MKGQIRFRELRGISDSFLVLRESERQSVNLLRRGVARRIPNQPALE